MKRTVHFPFIKTGKCIVCCFINIDDMTRKLLLIIFLFSLFSSVEAQHPQPKENIPEKALQFLEKHFKNYVIYRAKYDKKSGEWEIKLQSGHEIEFDYNGNWFEIDGETNPLPKSIIDLLPVDIMNYIAKNYPRRAILKIERESYGYEIELSNSVELQFSKNGKFLKED